MKTAYIEFKDVTRIYRSGDAEVKALENASFSISEGEFVVILGPSGAGKSTLLNLLGGMDKASSGQILIDGCDIANLSEKEMTAYRADSVGFVFQFYNLLPTLTVRENVEIVKEISKKTPDITAILTSVNLLERSGHFPSQLSGGEQQRVSIARAIAKEPRLMLCDEPTGALDSVTGIKVLSLLQSLSRRENRTIIIVTHNALFAQAADKVIHVKNGKISHVEVNSAPKSIEEVNL